MPKRGLVLAAAAAALLVAAPAVGRGLDHFTFSDGVGDGTPDITQVTVGSNASGAITFVVQLGAKKQLADNEVVFVLVESDGNAATGMQPDGADYLLQLDKTDATLFRWNGSDWQDTGSQTVYGYAYKGFRISVNRSDLALNGNELRFWVEAQAGEQFDEAPDGRIETYPLSAQPLALRVTGFAAVAKTVKVGKPYVVGMQLHRSDLDELTSAGVVRCTAKVGRKAVKVRAGFPDDIALCTGVAPKSAKGKTLKVTLTFELDGVRVSRTASIKVR